MRVGDVLKDRYELLREVSRQGSDSEWLAFDRVSNAAVTLRATDCGSEAEADSSLECYRRLVDRLGRVRDAHIVHVREIGKHQGGIYAVMEPVGGRTVTDLLREHGRLPVGDALSILRRAAEALQGTFNARLAHGAISADTIRVVLDHQGHPSGVRLLVYAAAALQPPVVEDDICALGILLYQMLSGSPPAQDASGQGDSISPAALKQLQSIRSDLPEQQLVALQQLLVRCTQSDPQHRIAKPADLMQAVDKLVPRPVRATASQADDDTVPTQPVQKVALAPTATALATLTTRSGRGFEITRPRVRVGRDAKGIVNDFDLRPEPGSVYVHRRHFRLEYVRGQWFLELEPGAEHPTYVHGKRVLPDQRVTLRHEDEINAAGVSMTFRILHKP